ncbi:response regulator [Leptolyngbya ohadii]|uniref:response regulator n=1 Tax=Leptolyngbya ohadii TaxID=1962290 RepID=UPI000B59D8BD|nr:response regulator [Leptolyngbya ohadii]
MTYCILVVDDEDSLRDLVCTCLEDLGSWTTIAAASGQEALVKAETSAIDAILLDISMPGMDGFQCYKKLKENPVTQHIPIVLLTAKVLPDERIRFAQMEVAGTIAKPFDPTLICDQIADLLNWD